MKFIWILSISLMACGTDLKYEITNEDPDDGARRTNVNVLIPGELTEAELTEIAKDIKRSRGNFERVYIFYSLPNMQPGDIAWATSHFTPELEVEIYGIPEDQNKVMLSVTAEGDILGKWEREEIMAERVFIVYRDRNNKSQLMTVLPDGSSYDQEVIIKDGTRIDYKDDNGHGEYFIIESDGNLGMYSPNGKFGECKAVN